MRYYQPRLSVIVPVYNSSKFLKQCLDSVVGQQIESLEVICINDGSTDNSLSILNDYANSDPRFTVITKINGGLPAARNTGLLHASGRYVLHLDSDDYLERGLLETVLKKAEQTDADITVFGGSTFPDKVDWANSALDVSSGTFCDNQVIEALFHIRGSRPFTWNKLYKLELIKKNQCYYDESIELGEDQAYQFSIFPLAKKIVYTPEPLYRYRQHNESMMTFYTSNSKMRLLGHLSLIDSVFNHWEDKLMAKYKPELLNWALGHIFLSDMLNVQVGDACEIGAKVKELFDKVGVSVFSLSDQDRESYRKILFVYYGCKFGAFFGFCNKQTIVKNSRFIEKIIKCAEFF